MDIRYVLRYPNIRQTPTVLAAALGVQTRKWPNKQKFVPSYNRDFLFQMPSPVELHEASTCLDTVGKATVVHRFFHGNKLSQRRYLSASGLPIPWTLGVSTGEAPEGEYVVRPFRHSGGADYNLVPHELLPQLGSNVYASQVFQKEREYRVVFVYGEPVIILRKRVPDGTASNQPWNHSVGGSFRTINDWASSKPVRCGAVEALKGNPVVRAAHIVGVDFLWRAPNEWVVLEFNSAPALTIEDNVSRVAAFIKEHTI